jgi:hypothetical protein
LVPGLLTTALSTYFVSITAVFLNWYSSMAVFVIVPMIYCWLRIIKTRHEIV